MAGRIRNTLEEWEENNAGHSQGGTVARLSKPGKGRAGGIAVGGLKGVSVLSHGSHAAPIGLSRSDLERVVDKSPEVMVKISKSSSDKKGISGYLKYISRNGELALEDNDGLLVQDKDERRELVNYWDESSTVGIPTKNGSKRQTINVILSMPSGTPERELRNAASAFAEKTFTDNPYVFVSHNDSENPHVHLVVRMERFDGTRLNPRKGDLNQWRRVFAKNLRDQGIDANATPRRARGVVVKAKSHSVYNIDKEHFRGRKIDRDKPGAVKRESLSDITLESFNRAVAEANGEKIPDDIANSDFYKETKDAKAAIQDTRAAVLEEYSNLHAALLTGNKDDQVLAQKIKTFVSGFPSTKTRYEILEGNIRRVQQEQKMSQSVVPDRNRIKPTPNKAIKPEPEESSMRRHLKKGRNGPKLS